MLEADSLPVSLMIQCDHKPGNDGIILCGGLELPERKTTGVPIFEILDAELRVIPHPTFSFFTITAPFGRTILGSELSDALGRSVARQDNVNAGGVMFETSGFSSGTYRVTVKLNDGSIRSVGVIVQR